jgi:hypothetical protein
VTDTDHDELSRAECYDRIRNQIEHEDERVNLRVVWQLLAQSFFFSTLLPGVFTTLANVNHLRRLYENYAAARTQDRTFQSSHSSAGPYSKTRPTVSNRLTPAVYRRLDRRVHQIARHGVVIPINAG